MLDRSSIAILHDRLIKERRRVVADAAATDSLPTGKLIAYLSGLDGAAMAVEAVMAESEDQASVSSESQLPSR